MNAPCRLGVLDPREKSGSGQPCCITVQTRHNDHAVALLFQGVMQPRCKGCMQLLMLVGSMKLFCHPSSVLSCLQSIFPCCHQCCKASLFNDPRSLIRSLYGRLCVSSLEYATYDRNNQVHFFLLVQNAHASQPDSVYLCMQVTRCASFSNVTL